MQTVSLTQPAPSTGTGRLFRRVVAGALRGNALAELTAEWQAEKQKLASSQKLKEQLDQARAELDQAQRRGDWARAGELTYGVIPDLERQLKEAEGAEKSRMLEEAVTPEHIAGVVSRWTGIPVDKMLEGERDKHMEENLRRRVIGQEEAVVAVSSARSACCGNRRCDPGRIRCASGFCNSSGDPMMSALSDGGVDF
jgi:ATP-dependent Clp protease ATP-binding subunit ClpA